MAASAALALAAPLPGCGSPPASQPDSAIAAGEGLVAGPAGETATPRPATTTPPPLLAPMVPSPPPPPSHPAFLPNPPPPPPIAAAAPVATPEAALARWAMAVERRDWAGVRALWGDHGARSGLSPTAFAARWDKLKRPRMSFGPGQQEGAAGSSYFTTPVTIRDGDRTIGGVVTLRRANDVPGASAEQLRWHIERADLPGLMPTPADAP